MLAYSSTSQKCPKCRGETDPLPLQNQLKEKFNRLGFNEFYLPAAVSKASSFVKNGVNETFINVNSNYPSQDSSLKEIFQLDLNMLCEKVYRASLIIDFEVLR